MSKRYTSWSLTLNNYDTVQTDLVWEELPPTLSYFATSREVAPTTGTPHLQGYCQSKLQKTTSAVEKILNKDRPKGRRAWRVIPSNGNAEQNIKYITKDGPIVAFGVYREMAGAKVDQDGNKIEKVTWLERFIRFAEEYTRGKVAPVGTTANPDCYNYDVLQDCIVAYFSEKGVVLTPTQMKQIHVYDRAFFGRLFQKVDEVENVLLR